jgi:predicted HAD superfamily Cof-like phosphohydrolase
MMEELAELTVAMHERNLVECADGLIDLMYVTVGALVDMGLGPIMDEMFYEVHKANMTKDFLDKGDGRKGGFKGMKYCPPDLTHIIVEQIRKVTGQEPCGWNK